jgi:DDE_Tnp_1-associated
MSETPLVSISKHSVQVVDPRVEHTTLHQLLDIITIVICEVICGADDWVEVAEKSYEITAIPVLLQTLALHGYVVTIDAMGCQTEIAKTIIRHQATYVLSL